MLHEVAGVAQSCYVIISSIWRKICFLHGAVNGRSFHSHEKDEKATNGRGVVTSRDARMRRVNSEHTTETNFEDERRTNPFACQFFVQWRINSFCAHNLRQVIYCAVPKAASTTWKSLMARATRHRLTESMTEHQVEDAAFLRSIGLRFLSTYTESQAAVRLGHYFKFAVVRHPLTRLASAYRDKIARFNSYGVDVRQRIAASLPANVSNESKSATTRSNRFQRITFQQFVRCDAFRLQQLRRVCTCCYDVHWSSRFIIYILAYL